jgi:hypothetical protein
MLFPICMAQVINALHRRIQFFPRHVFQVLSAPCWIKLPPSNVIIRHRSLTPRRGPTFYRHFSRHRLAQLCSDYAPPFRDRVAPPFRRVSVLSGPAGSAHARDVFAPPTLRLQPVLSNGGKCLTVWQVCGRLSRLFEETPIVVPEYRGLQGESRYPKRLCATTTERRRSMTDPCFLALPQFCQRRSLWHLMQARALDAVGVAAVNSETS